MIYNRLSSASHPITRTRFDDRHPLPPRNIPQTAIVILVHAACLLALFNEFRGGYLIAFFCFHFVTGCLGISVGYHRLLSHKAFKASPHLEGLLAFFGALALMGGPLTWAALHRAHHKHNDESGDPHSRKLGFFWSHFLWTTYRKPNDYSPLKGLRRVKDLREKTYLRFLEKHYLTINAAVAAAYLGAFGFASFLWAFPVRVVVVWHTTWLINSLAHSRAETGCSIRNIPWLAAISYGEGFHAGHHQRPQASNFRAERRYFDMGFVCVKIFQVCGLVQIREKAQV